MRLRYVIPSLWLALWLGNSGFGACAADSPNPRYDFGAPTDMGSPFADMMSYPGDLGLASRSVALVTPSPFSSGNALDTNFVFDVRLPALPAQPEMWLTIMPRSGTSTLAGAFSSKSVGPGRYNVTFLPSAQLQNGADYVIVARDPQDLLQELLRTGITAGSHPRVRYLKLEASGVKDLLLKISFSEAMKQSTLSGALVVKHGTPPTMVVSGGMLTRISDADYTYLIPNGQTLPGTFLVHLSAGVTSLGGTPLDPKSWDSPTDASGAFEHEMSGAGDEFVPEVN